MRVRAKARGYDGVAVREEGEEFDFNGKLGSWMEPVGGGDASPAGSDKSSDQAKPKKGDKAA